MAAQSTNTIETAPNRMTEAVTTAQRHAARPPGGKPRVGILGAGFIADFSRAKPRGGCFAEERSPGNGIRVVFHDV